MNPAPFGVSPPGPWRLRPRVKHYAWGSTTAIPELLGQPSPVAEPQAELWMGTHPQAPSEVRAEGGWRPLAELVDGGELPFLFKVLAADRPLSIQTHPDAEQARRGFAREEAAGILREAAHRNYRDANPKPEILYALTEFHVLRGFRPASTLTRWLTALGLDDLPGASALREGGDVEQVLRGFLQGLLEAPQTTVRPHLDTAIAAAQQALKRSDGDLAWRSACRWLLRLAEHYPGDRGLLAPLFLEVTTLQPGQALYTGPRTFHAYLEGCGLELMVSSDNVLRGGLTQKHVDVAELLAVLRFAPEAPKVLQPSRPCAGREVFACPNGRLRLTRWQLTPGQAVDLDAGTDGSILLCVAGAARWTNSEEPPQATGDLDRGAVVFLPPSERSHRLVATQPGTLVFQAQGAAAHIPVSTDSDDHSADDYRR